MTPQASTSQDFAQRVAAILRVLGGKNISVAHPLAGFNIDVYAELPAPNGSILRTAIECKAYRQPVEAEVVASVAPLAIVLRQRDLVDQFYLVSVSRFTSGAFQNAKSAGIELLKFQDLEDQVKDRPAELSTAVDAVRKNAAKADSLGTKPKRVFVVMPFAPEFDDVYILGIREVAENLGLVVDRADDIEHNEDILRALQEQLRGADVVVADMTSRNPNCFYEIGYAHASRTPTILISRTGQDVPVDLRSLNHIKYGSIVDLRESLSRRLVATLRLDSSQPPAA